MFIDYNLIIAFCRYFVVVLMIFIVWSRPEQTAQSCS